MSDDFIKEWDSITDPREALAQIVEHEDFLGYDPYYAELRKALMRMAERCSTVERSAADRSGK